MTSVKYVPDHKGWEQVLLGVQPTIDSLAEAVRASVAAQLPADGQGEVVAERYDFKPRGRTSRRAAASVAVLRPDAKLLQARDGLLTRAAAGRGLEVNAKADG